MPKTNILCMFCDKTVFNYTLIAILNFTEDFLQLKINLKMESF